MKCATAVLASVGRLISAGGTPSRHRYWDKDFDYDKHVLIHEDYFNDLANIWDDYQAIKAEDEERQRELEIQDVEDTIATYQASIEGAIRRGARR